MHIFCDKIVKTRRKRVCWGCHFRFGKGKEMRYMNFRRTSGEYVRIYFCKKCGEILGNSRVSTVPGSLWDSSRDVRCRLLEFWSRADCKDKPESWGSLSLRTLRTAEDGRRPTSDSSEICRQDNGLTLAETSHGFGLDTLTRMLGVSRRAIDLFIEHGNISRRLMEEARFTAPANMSLNNLTLGTAGLDFSSSFTTAPTLGTAPMHNLFTSTYGTTSTYPTFRM